MIVRLQPGRLGLGGFVQQRSGFSPSNIRSLFMLEPFTEMIKHQGFSLNQAQVQVRRQGDKQWAVTAMGSDSAETIRAVGRREIDIAIVNPAGPLGAAYRGRGPFSEPIDVRTIAVIPSLDWMGFAVANRTGLRSLADIKDRHYPLKISVRDQDDHVTHIYIEQVLRAYGFSLADIISWGGSVSRSKAMGYQEVRNGPVKTGEIDAIFDEGLTQFIPKLDDLDMTILPIDEPVLQYMDSIGLHRASIPMSSFPNLPADVPTLCFSGWPIYTHADASDDLIYQYCRAIDARKDEIPTQFLGPLPIQDMVTDTPAAPLKVPLHPAAERYWREAGYLK
jgi:TRAP-type uncharacterized transport system substrate-binding protein